MNLVSMVFYIFYIPLILATDKDDDYVPDYELGGTDISSEEEVKLVNSDDKPNFVTKGGLIYGQLGLPLSLPCQVNHLGGRDMIWTRESNNSAPDQLFIVDTKIVSDEQLELELLEGGEGTVLLFNKLMPHHAGNYTCSIADASVKTVLRFEVGIISEQEIELRSSGPNNKPFPSFFEMWIFYGLISTYKK
ncbi:uncharacterized protein LOC111716495 [Eurytemora carolleeae]|uniref:uncharacterized protein LOC111716495 n=1 Tax=Eurytemora carolleeae TaxID=1294199 RepID=UPI000C781DB9|nr:uncharacterized protein LOC111716495 [Eurytemora carolleeae]|eukprot:XP_023347734.1 uncharacterized protein LOC111716495 [Eurytemora affinis]